MYYVPVTTDYVRLPTTYVPIYPTALDRALIEQSNSRLSNDLFRVRKELAELREELTELRLEQDTCPLCLASLTTTRTYICDTSCSICYPYLNRRTLDDSSYRTSPTVHYCSICHDYVMDLTYPPPYSCTEYIKEKEDKLTEYLSRQLELYRLRYGRATSARSTWIPTAYKNDYPYRRWVTRRSYFSEP